MGHTRMQAEQEMFILWNPALCCAASLKSSGLDLAAPSMVTAPSSALVAASEEQPRCSSIIPAPDTPHLIVPHTATDSSPFAHGDASGQLHAAARLAARPMLGGPMLPTARDHFCLLQGLPRSQQPAAAAAKQPSSNVEGWLAGWAALAAASKPLPPAAGLVCQPATPPASDPPSPAAPSAPSRIMWPAVRARAEGEAGASSPSKRARVGRGQAAQLPSSADALAAFKAAWAGNVARSYVKWC